MSFNRAEYDTEALRNNFRLVRRLVGPERKICTAVKANGYGFGDIEMARIMQREGADYLAVAIVEEGVRLRKAGIDLPILVLGAIPGEEFTKACAFGLTCGIYARRTAEYVSNIGSSMSRHLKIHMVVDTGMHRLGFTPEPDLNREIEDIMNMPYLDVEGIFSHLSQTDKSREFTLRQIDTFKGVLSGLKQNGLDIPIAHIANSNAILDYPEAYFDMVRPGILLHGFGCGSQYDKELKEVLSVKSRIVRIHKAPAGSEVSYMGNYVTEGERLIATVPVGYADGLFRCLSGKCSMLVRGQRVPQVGNICMDQCMLDVTDVPGVSPDDEVVIIGGQGDEYISCTEQAEKAGTITYELLTSCKRIPKYYLPEE